MLEDLLDGTSQGPAGSYFDEEIHRIRIGQHGFYCLAEAHW